ncbi:MAG TPA: iron ABC transporter permease [Actinomycetota bacterium]|nr:iron ABC transporter permease [Actinomycetota bacterium]
MLLVVGAVLLIVGYLALTPLGYLLWGTFFDEGGFTLRFFEEALSQQDFAEVALTSFAFSGGATVLAMVIGCALAYLLVRTDIALKRVIFAGSLVPLIVPSILQVISWIFLLAPRTGFLNRIAASLSLGPFDIFSLPGMIFVEGMGLAPLVFLLMAAALRSMDPSLEESALMSGANLNTVIRRVTLPIVRPALFAALLIMGVHSLQAFETPAILGIPDGTWTFTSRIWNSLHGFPREFGPAGAYSVMLLALTGVGVFLHSRLTKRSTAWQTVTGRGYRPRPIELGRWRGPLTAAALGYVVFVVVLPLMIMFFASFQPYFAAISVAATENLSLDNYRLIFERRNILRSTQNSLVLGISSATFIMFLTAVAAWLVVRTRVAGRWVVDNLTFLPIVVPGLVMGVALLFVYLRHPVPIYGTLWILFIAFLTKYMPYGMRFASSSMFQIGVELEESARMSGASWWQSFRRIVLPLLFPGLIAGWIYVLVVSIRELSTAILVYSPGNEVLAVEIWELWQDGRLTQLAALGTLMVVALLALAGLAYKIGSRIGIRETALEPAPLPGEL